ncbi:ABC transporter substrate-binding protein [Rhizomonospora bruguierae]|uniref:ABC transporter substrate-binding protein n=1 Tax=Rhizomonospora bruguierae TaxID=1581705 RepID=UPI001BCA9D25|nr:ABC transporter substrate-binding protein [Micromonospora sp. NBRC 107566]
MTLIDRRPSRLAALAAAALLTTTATGCSGSPEAGRTPAPHRVKVTYLTGLGSFGREGYAWVAREKGYFAEAGLDVEIQPGAAGDSNLSLVAAGRAQFAVIDYAGAVVRAGTDAFTGYRLVSVVTRQTLIAMMALGGGDIANPRDLAGRTIAQATGAVPKTLFPAYARLAGFDPSGVHWIQATPQQLPALLAAGRVDAIGQFVVGEPSVRRAAQGRPVVVMPYSDYVTDLYGNVVVASTALLESDPDLVRRFTRALVKGLLYAVDHPQESGQILHRAVPAVDAATAAEEIALMRPYVLGDHTPGAFDPARVARSVALIQSLRLIPAAIRPEEFVNFDTMGS